MIEDVYCICLFDIENRNNARLGKGRKIEKKVENAVIDFHAISQINNIESLCGNALHWL